MLKVKEHAKYEEQNIAQEISEIDDFTVERYEQFYKFFQPDVVSVLDIGCNKGRGGVRLKQLNSKLEIHGLDCVEERLNALPKEYSDKVYGLSNKIPVDDKTYDVVVAGEFLEHLYPSDVDTTLCEIQRVLKVGGRLLMTTPNPLYLKNVLKNITVYTTSHLTQHYPRVLKYRMLMHGFSKVKIYGSGRLSRYLGYHFPLTRAYGSFLIIGDKI